MMRKPSILLAIALAALAGCATDQVALDHANATVQLIQNLQTELTTYQSNVKLSAQRRLKSTQQSDIVTLEIAREQQWSSYLYKESGLTSELEARARLREASDTYSKIIADQDKAQEELAARLTTITKDLPTPSDKLGAVQKAMAQLGVELSVKERVGIVKKFVKQAKCIVNQSTASPPAAAPAPAASAPAAASTPASASAPAPAPAASAASPAVPAGCTSADSSSSTPEKS